MRLKKNFRRSASIFLLVGAIVTSLVVPAAAADNAASIRESYNLNHQNYITISRSADIVNSNLIKTDSGYMRVEYIDDAVYVEYYNNNFQLCDQLTVKMELDIYGGFYEGAYAYYLAFGQNNPDEDDNLEVCRIVKYDKNWNRLGSASVYGTMCEPFRSSTCKMVEYNGYLYVRTAYLKYANESGTRHQANITIIADESAMNNESTVAMTTGGLSYCSHSFDQFMLVDDSGNLMTVDLGDAYPRSIMLGKNIMKNSEYYNATESTVDVMNINGPIGNNYSGISLGGFEYSDSSYIIAGNSVYQQSDDEWEESYARYSNRNIFITTTSKDNFSEDGTTIKWITNYPEGSNVTVSVPQLVKISNNRFLLMWTTTENNSDTMHYVFLDGYGNMISNVYDTTDAAESDCQPIVSGDNIVWYVTGDKEGNQTEPTFYEINITSGKLYSIAATEYANVIDEKENNTDNTTNSPFTDVNNPDEWYYDAVLWAVNNNITTGTSATEFSYAADCTRAQVVTFLWRAAGCPDPENDCNPFVDVVYGEDTEWYYNAVLWAVENNITTGTSETTFEPDATCTRSQVVTFIWRFANEPTPQNSYNPFEDVEYSEETNWYYDAMLWAVENGITTGTSATTFTPANNCTRAEIVTFLYRYFV